MGDVLGLPLGEAPAAFTPSLSALGFLEVSWQGGISMGLGLLPGFASRAGVATVHQLNPVSPCSPSPGSVLDGDSAWL